MDSERAARIAALVAAIPEGFVCSYGEICPEAPRLTGAVLGSDLGAGLPWHRVVRADGSLAQGARQRRLLEGEGVPFVGDRVDLDAARIPGEALVVEAATGAPPGSPSSPR